MKAGEKKPAKPSRNIIGILVVAFVALLLWKSLHKDEDSEPQQTMQVAVSPAQKLASLDAGAPQALPPADEKVVQIDALLNSISKVYNESPELIANATYVAAQDLKRRGIKESHYNILVYMNQQVITQGLRYKQAVMQYAASRKQ